MLRYAAKRSAQAIFVVIGVTFIVFLIFHLAPGDPLTVISGNRRLPPDTAANLKHSFGLDKPLLLQYFFYLKNLFSGDLGFSFSNGRPVLDVLKNYYPNSIKLALTAVIVEAFIGVAIGIYAAIKKDSFFDIFTTVASAALISIPVFWLGMMLQQFFGVGLRLLPVSGMGDGGIGNFVLPVLTLTAVYTAFIIQTTRSGMIGVLGQNYIKVARAGGLPQSSIILKYGLKNALAPVVTLLGLDLGALMGGAVATEVIYNWPGIGNQIYLAILARDRPLALGAILSLVIIFITINLIVDLIYSFLDPRIKSDMRKAA